jgi:RNA recognition motif-containing protein
LQRGRNQATIQERTIHKLNGENGESGACENMPTNASSRWGSSFMQRYDRDRRSVFCGNLPTNTTESELRQVFGRVGKPIKGIEIVRGVQSAYAFIEFSRPDAYETAMAVLVSIFSKPPFPEAKVVSQAASSPLTGRLISRV